MAPPIEPEKPKRDPFAAVFLSIVAVAVLYVVGGALVKSIIKPPIRRTSGLTVEAPPYITQQEAGPLAQAEITLIAKLGNRHLQGFFHPHHLVLASSESLAGGQLNVVRNGAPPRRGPYLKVTPSAVFTAVSDMEAYAAHRDVERFGIGGSNVNGHVSFRVRPAIEAARYLVIDSSAETLREFWPNTTNRSPAYPKVVATFIGEEATRGPSILDNQVQEGLFRFYQGVCETAVQVAPVNARLHAAPIEVAGRGEGSGKRQLTLPLAYPGPPPQLPPEAAEHLVCESQGAALAFARTGIPYAEYQRRMNGDYSQTFEGELVANYTVVNRYEYEHDIATA